MWRTHTHTHTTLTTYVWRAYARAGRRGPLAMYLYSRFHILGPAVYWWYPRKNAAHRTRMDPQMSQPYFVVWSIAALCWLCVVAPWGMKCMRSSCFVSYTRLTGWRCWLALYAQSEYVFFFFFSHIYFPASGQAVVTRVVLSHPRCLRSFFIAYRVQKAHCSSIFHRVLLNSRSRAFPKSICAQEKVPTNSSEYVCTRGYSNSRNWPIPGSRIPWYATGATGLYMHR